MLKRRERHPLDRGKTISEFSVARPCDRSFSRNNLSLSLSMLHYALRKMTDISGAIFIVIYLYFVILWNFHQKDFFLLHSPDLCNFLMAVLLEILRKNRVESDVAKNILKFLNEYDFVFLLNFQHKIQPLYRSSSCFSK